MKVQHRTIHYKAERSSIMAAANGDSPCFREGLARGVSTGAVAFLLTRPLATGARSPRGLCPVASPVRGRPPGRLWDPRGAGVRHARRAAAAIRHLRLSG